MRIARDRRALGLGTLGFFAILAVCALLFILIDPAVDKVVTMSESQTSDQQALNVISTRKRIWELVLFMGIIIAGVFIIARSVREASP